MIIPIIIIILCSYLLFRFCTNFDKFSKVIGNNLTQGVRGATINAIGSSLPEFFTALFFLFFLNDIDGFSSGLATILGSAIFNILLIPAVVIFIMIRYNHNLKINKKLIIRDSGILLVSQLFLLYLLQDGVINIRDASVLFVIYIGYLLVLSRGGLFDKNDNKEMYKQRRKGVWTAIIWSVLRISVTCLLLVFACEVLFTGVYPEFLSFLDFSTNDNFLGIEKMMYVALIFAAAASSVPDMLISAFDAKSGDVDDSLSNPVASNLFDICIAFGFALFIFTIFNGQIKFDNDPSVFQDIYTLIVIMICVTILFLISLLVSKNYKMIHAIFFTLLFVLFIFSVFHLEELYKLIPWL